MVAQDYDGNEENRSFDKKTGKGVSVLAEKVRTWQVVANNPDEHNITPDTIAETLSSLCESGRISYWCCIYEQSLSVNSKTGKPTLHIHIALYFPGQARGSQVQKLFPHAGIFSCDGTVASLVAYLKKDTEGAWYKTHPEKLGEKLPPEQARFTEWGDMPQSKKMRPLATPEKLVTAIRDGLSDAELLNLDPSIWKNFTAIRQTRAVIRSDEFLKKFRKMEVIYIEGPTSTGKTRDVLLTESYNVFVIDDYTHPWDYYEQEDVVFFDEFRSQVNITEMLRWLDGNPVKLKARYANAVACYTRVYIASNWPLDEQYENIRKTRCADWLAFMRRINERRIYRTDGTIECFINNNNVWTKKGNIETQKEDIHV
ncbi:MAG: RNA helicase domain-containing protein [Muribaculaceae bacterium]|nr:RNA helicase domain-containing protein [Muribaculaceae bacterium]